MNSLLHHISSENGLTLKGNNDIQREQLFA